MLHAEWRLCIVSALLYEMLFITSAAGLQPAGLQPAELNVI